MYCDDIQDQLPLDEELEQLAGFFKVLGDSTRVKILSALYVRELCVCELAGILEMNQPAISHQLRVLRAARVVKGRKQGKHVYYSLDDNHVRKLLHDGLEHIQGDCN